MASCKSEYDAVDAEKQEFQADWKAFTLEVRGMDCIDCLNKIKRAFGPLRGARTTSMDYMRAIVGVEYDPSERIAIA